MRCYFKASHFRQQNQINGQTIVTIKQTTQESNLSQAIQIIMEPDTETESRLARLCIEAACASGEAVEIWRRQRRTLESIPSPLADSLFRLLHHRRLLFPSLLAVFKHSVEVVDLTGDNSVDAEWIAYLGSYRYLRSLNLANCQKITSSSLFALAGMSSLKELDLSRCTKVNDAGIRHLLSISSLEVLRISQTGVTATGVMLLSSLKNLRILDLGGLPVTDKALSSLQVLKRLEHLDLWGSNVSNKAVRVLQTFPKLSFLDLAWTDVTRLPNIPSLEYLNLSNCTIDCVLEGNGGKAPLVKLILFGATFLNEAEAFLNIETRFLSFLDLSNSSLRGFDLLYDMAMLEYLDLSSCMMGDESIETVACIGANIRNLNLSKTRVSSSGLAVLAGHVPKLESLSLSHTPIDDFAISYISLMPSLKILDLSSTNIKGFIHQVDTEPNLIPSLAALQSLCGLETLNLEHTKLHDAALDPLLTFQNLSYLSLRSASLTDVSLHLLSSLPKLTNLGFCDAVLTDQGLDSFRPPASLRVLDLMGCWLLSKEALLSFCGKHPLIKARHELSGVCTSDQHGSNYPSPSQLPSRTSQVNRKHGKMTMSWPISHRFVDQRLKYMREEILALQFQSSSLASSPNGGLMASEV